MSISETVVIISRDVQIDRRLREVAVPDQLTLLFRSGSAELVDPAVMTSLAQIVVSPGDIGVGAAEAESIAGLCAAGLSPLLFLFNPEIEDIEDREQIEATAGRWIANHQPNVSVHSGGIELVNQVLAMLVHEQDSLAAARDRRIAVAKAAADLAESEATSLALRSRLAVYLNIRIECDATIKAAKQLEAGVDSVHAEALQRLNEAALTTRLRSGLKVALAPTDGGGWAATTPNILSDLATEWQADQLDNMLRDIKRFCPVTVHVRQQRVGRRIELSADLQPVSAHDISSSLMRSGSSMLLVSTFVTVFTPVSFLALPAGALAGFAMWLKSKRDGTTATLNRFVDDISTYLYEATRETMIETRRSFKTASDSIKAQIRKETELHISRLLEAKGAMSDTEAAEITQRLRDLSASSA